MQLLPSQIDLKISHAPVEYGEAVEFMHNHVEAMLTNQARSLIWFLHHPSLYTAGTSAKPQDLLDAGGFPVYPSNRGGQYTYHGPGQRIIYVMLDISAKRDIRALVQALEQWVMESLKQFGIQTCLLEGKIGIWVKRADSPSAAPRYDKIAALGIRVRKWIAFHGVAVNICPDLSHFAGIVACGVRNDGYGVTSMQALGKTIPLTQFDAGLTHCFEKIFTSRLVPAADDTADNSPHQTDRK